MQIIEKFLMRALRLIKGDQRNPKKVTQGCLLLHLGRVLLHLPELILNLGQHLKDVIVLLLDRNTNLNPCSFCLGKHSGHTNFFTAPRLRTGGFSPDHLARFGASPMKQSDLVCL